MVIQAGKSRKNTIKSFHFCSTFSKYTIIWSYRVTRIGTAVWRTEVPRKNHFKTTSYIHCYSVSGEVTNDWFADRTSTHPHWRNETRVYKWLAWGHCMTMKWPGIELVSYNALTIWPPCLTYAANDFAVLSHLQRIFNKFCVFTYFCMLN